MPEPGRTPASVDAHVAGVPVEVRAILERIRQVVREVAPDAEERIGNGMPTFSQHGVLVHFAAFRRHIGLYPPVGDPALVPLVAPYAGPKGTLQFPLTDPIPCELVARIAAARLRETPHRHDERVSSPATRAPRPPLRRVRPGHGGQQAVRRLSRGAPAVAVTRCVTRGDATRQLARRSGAVGGPDAPAA